MRKLRTLFTLLVVSMCAVQSAWAQEEQTISVSLRESGGLSAEIFAAQANNHWEQSLSTVVNLTITSGELNADDWNTLKSMTALKTLDMGGTSNKNFPAYQFDEAGFNIQTIVFPSNLETLGECAFRLRSSLVTAVLPPTLVSVGEFAFSSCTNLENVGTAWPSGASTIPRYCFYECYKLHSFSIPEGVTIIGSYAFNNCNEFASTLPSTLQYIGESAFYGSLQDIDVVLSPEITLDTRAFEYSKIRSIVLPATYTSSNLWPFYECTNLKDVTIMSPTVINSGSDLTIPQNENLNIYVPDYLVNAYKSDTYFSQFNIEGFDITLYNIVWPIDYSFALNNYTRMNGEPKIKLAYNIVLSVTGDDVQKFGEITLNSNLSDIRINDGYNNYTEYYKNWSQILSTCDNVRVTGNYYQRIGTLEKQWYFICLPFDVDLSSIATENNAKYAIRYYDGANRATNNSATGNWKDCVANGMTVIPAGTGFIYQTSQDTWTTFKAVLNDSRNNVFKNEEIVKSLLPNATPGESEVLDAANKGWNFIGNPWQCYYNIHKLNYAAPICIYNGGTYVAYSIQDDDIALEPNQAFFVQCPDEVSSIGFPIDGRQLTSEVTSVSAARQLSPAEKERWLVDVQIAYGEDMRDKTRLVVNNKAQMDYEIGSDASKFMSTDGLVPQIYSLDAEGTEYAINERPLDNGILPLGVMIKEGGQYTISAIRNDIGQVLLTDHETGITTNLSQNGYCFNANAGTYEGRFALSFLSGELTGIKTIDNSRLTNDNYYNLNGQLIDQPTKGVYVVGGKKVIMK